MAMLWLMCLPPPAAANGVRSVAAGATWQVASTTHLSDLSIAVGARLIAPSGENLTLTVNGVQTPLAPGTYRGNVVLTPTQPIPIRFDDMGAHRTDQLRAALYVDDGAYVPSQSVAAAVTGGAVSDARAQGIAISSVGPIFNGVVVQGHSTYVIDDATIRLSGYGRNDFDGFGAAIRIGGYSRVTLNRVHIDDTGAVRTAIWVGDHAVATINDSDIEVHDGPLPADYGWSWLHPQTSTDVMMAVPWMLGLRGDNRATLVVGAGTVYYNNTHIRAEGWGALSTDATHGGVHLYATHCRIETVKNGYGAYSVDGSLDTFRDTVFDVADYGLIMAGGSGVFTDGSVVNSRRIGVMSHGPNQGVLRIDRGSVFNTEKAVIQLKSSTPTIIVDHAQLRSRSGVILQAMVNDDPNAANAAGPPPDEAPARGAPVHAAAARVAPDIHALFSNTTADGDLVNAMTALGGLVVTLEHSTLRGAITSAIPHHAVGPHGERLVMQEKPDLYYLIGEEIDTYAATGTAHGVQVALRAGSRWIVTKSSYLTGLRIAPGTHVSAASGSRLTMTVNGIATSIVPGFYSGRIVLAVQPRG